MVTTPTAWVVARQLRSAAVRGLRGPFFRGRAFKRGEKPSGPHDFYWQERAWQEYVSAGHWQPDRYNENGERVLYLSRDPDTAAVEGGQSGCTAFVQKFELDLPTARCVLLDNRLEARHPYLHHLLLNSEFLPGESHLRFPYRTTHLIAYLCAWSEIDAVEYPSVRANGKGVNLVLFRAAMEAARGMMVGEPFDLW